MRFKKFRPRENRDKLIYGDGIVEGIVLLAVAEIPYAEVYRGVSGKQPKENAVKVVIDKSNVNVDVIVSIHYSQCVSDMAFMIQEAVKYNVESMTDYNVNSVNVIVKGVMFNEIVLNGNGNGNGNNGNNGEEKNSASVAADSEKSEIKD